MSTEAIEALERLADQAFNTAGGPEGRRLVNEDRETVLRALQAAAAQDTADPADGLRARIEVLATEWEEFGGDFPFAAHRLRTALLTAGMSDTRPPDEGWVAMDLSQTRALARAYATGSAARQRPTRQADKA